MMDPERIKRIIAEELPCEGLHVEGDGEHFEAILVCSKFAGLSRVQRQQMVNAILKPYFDSGELHALSMRTLTPEERKALCG
ncbi:BolA family protein [Propionivibrio soli]|uniref:BolA family protein n=1 Tax=Propionivibrio soli TaxID=2976531 RepID=UPI0021E81E80|nr:BolA family protein [Propionivibrio soli]